MTKSHCAGLLLLMLLPLIVQGQASIVVEPGDKTLVIKGWVGDDASFIGNIGVTVQGAQGSNPIKLNIYRTDLKTADGKQTILRQLVSVTGEQTLTPDATSIYQVKVTGVREAGEYRGTIFLSLAGQPRDAAVAVDVTLIASVRSALSLLSDTDRLQANLVNCTYDCMLARLVLSTAAFQNKIELGFEKPSGAPLVINDVTSVVKGDQTRFKLDADKLKVSLNELTASQPSSGNTDPWLTRKYLTLPVSIASHEIPADHYAGSIYLTVAGQSNSLKVPVDLNVRSGPLWPLLSLLAGILLGRLAKFMQEKGNAIVDALESINRLEFRLRDVDAEDAQIINPMLSATRDLVTQGRAVEALAAANAISARLSTLGELRQIQARLTGKESNPAVPPILNDIAQAREHIALQQDDKAKNLIGKIKDALAALAATPPVTDTDTSDLEDARKKGVLAAAAMAPLGITRESLTDRLRSAMALLVGISDEVRTEAIFFLVRPILWLALLLGLLAVGLKTLYVDNLVFGANAFTDFLGLMFWGLSADVASRTISSLRISNASRPAGG